MHAKAWTFQTFKMSYTKNVVKVHAQRWQNRLPSQGMMYMGYIHCCGALHKTRSFCLSPQEQFLMCELDYLPKCPICGHTVVQLTRIDKEDNISIIRKVNKKAREFFIKLKKFILFEEKPINYNRVNSGSFYLNYNEFGVKKRCYSNLKALKIGLRENKDLKLNP